MAGTDWRNFDDVLKNLKVDSEDYRKYFVKKFLTTFGDTANPVPTPLNTPEYKELAQNVNDGNRGAFRTFIDDYEKKSTDIHPVIQTLCIHIETDNNLDFLKDNASMNTFFAKHAPLAIVYMWPGTNLPGLLTGIIAPPGNWQVHRSLNIITYNLDGIKKQPDINTIMDNGFKIYPKYLILLQGAENYKLPPTVGAHVHEIGGSNGFKKLYICAQNNTATPTPGYDLTNNKHNLYGFTKTSADKLLWLATYSDEGNYIIVNVQFPKDSSGNFPANFKRHITDRLTTDPNFEERIRYGYAVFIAGDMGCDKPATELNKGGVTNALGIVGFDTPAGNNTYKPTSGSGFTEVRDHILFNVSVDATGFPAAINVLDNKSTNAVYKNIEDITTHLPVIAGVDFYIQHATVTNYKSGHTRGIPSSNPDLTSAKTDDGKIGSMLDTMAFQIATMPDTQLNSIKNLYNFTRGHVAVPVKAPAPAGTPPVTPPPVTPPPVTPPPAKTDPTVLPPKTIKSFTLTNVSANYNHQSITPKYKPTNTTDLKKAKHTTITDKTTTFGTETKAIEQIHWNEYETANKNIFYGNASVGPKGGRTDLYKFKYDTTTSVLTIRNHTSGNFENLTIVT